MEEIRNLVVQYPHGVDKGDFDAVGEFYDGATVRAYDGAGNLMGEEHTRDAGEVKKFYEDALVVDGQGNPNTQHLVSNIQVEVDEDCTTGSCRSNFTVFNQGDGFPLQLVITGWYVDKFERVDGTWRLRDRSEYMGLVGDLSHHLKADLGDTARL
jgi:hypothetical protein